MWELLQKHGTSLSAKLSPGGDLSLLCVFCVWVSDKLLWALTDPQYQEHRPSLGVREPRTVTSGHP